MVDVRNEKKLNLALIGVGARGKENLGNALRENVVAICDTDESMLFRANQRCRPGTRFYSDYRLLLEEMSGVLDAVVISTPDHSHFPIAMDAMDRGLHCYCEKPLAHSVRECRLMAQKAKEKRLITQMGNQMHTTENYRRVVELLRAGTLGRIHHAHVWCKKGWGGVDTPLPSPEEPTLGFHWDSWLCNAKKRPFVEKIYHPSNWRRWWDFGSGTLGDMGCHYMDIVFWALGLTHPYKIAASGPDLAHQKNLAPLSLKVEYLFPSPDAGEEIRVTWYDGDYRPEVLDRYGFSYWLGGVVFEGTEGALAADYTQRIFAPEEKFKGTLPEVETIPPSPGHFVDFCNAIRSGTPTDCDFSYTSRLTETILLGVAAYRSGGEILWDAERLCAGSNSKAQFYIEGLS
ncbi:MAG: Gfo/Idh/MocA family oxidoreductase [Planctomycetia bacterium]|nr:Gfo/Idh/MocA family oxidoreductase [Planctomycetia bacterium]